MGLPWSPASGFTCQLWWIFVLPFRCSKLLGRSWRQEMDGGLGDVGCKQVRRGEREEIRPSLLPTKPGWKARISTYEQQIFIGIPFIIHYIKASSEGLHQVGCVAGVSWQARLTEKSMLHFKFIKAAYHLSIWISKGASMGPVVC